MIPLFLDIGNSFFFFSFVSLTRVLSIFFSNYQLFKSWFLKLFVVLNSISLNFPLIIDSSICWCVFLWVYSGKVCLAFWIWRFIYFAKFGKFAAIISSSNFFIPLFFSTPMIIIKENTDFFFNGPMILESLHFFQIGDFFYSIFKFSNSFLCSLNSESVVCVVYFNYCVFSFKISI